MSQRLAPGRALIQRVATAGLGQQDDCQRLFRLIQGLHLGSLRRTTGGAFTPRESAHTADQGTRPTPNSRFISHREVVYDTKRLYSPAFRGSLRPSATHSPLLRQASHCTGLPREVTQVSTAALSEGTIHLPLNIPPVPDSFYGI